MYTIFTMMALAAGFGLAISATASAFGISRGLQATVESIARQPESAGDIRGISVIGLALIEALTIYMFLIALLLWLRLPGAALLAK